MMDEWVFVYWEWMFLLKAHYNWPVFLSFPPPPAFLISIWFLLIYCFGWSIFKLFSRSYLLWFHHFSLFLFQSSDTFTICTWTLPETHIHNLVTTRSPNPTIQDQHLINDSGSIPCLQIQWILTSLYHTPMIPILPFWTSTIPNLILRPESSQITSRSKI